MLVVEIFTAESMGRIDRKSFSRQLPREWLVQILHFESVAIQLGMFRSPNLLYLHPQVEPLEGYTIGNDVSSRSIEGENPLYLPQAKTFDQCVHVLDLVFICLKNRWEIQPIFVWKSCAMVRKYSPAERP